MKPALSVWIVLLLCTCESDRGPHILLEVCSTPVLSVGDFVGGYEDCAAAFGQVDISSDTDLRLKVLNPSAEPLTLVNLETTGSPAFTISSSPSVVDADSFGEVVVRARANVSTTFEGTLLLFSDATNTPQTTDGQSLVSVALSAFGVDNGIPDIEIEPVACPFGEVDIGAVATCSITLSNRGASDLIIDVLAIEDCGEDCTFRLGGGALVSGAALPPATQVELVVELLPTALGAVAATLLIASNDPDEPSIVVGLTGEGL